MKQLISPAAVLFSSMLFMGCAGQQNCPAPNMMPPPMPPPCCNNNGPGDMHQMHGDNNRPPSGPHRDMAFDKGMAHPPRMGMGGPVDHEQAQEACTGKKDNDVCTFTDKGWTLTGVCSKARRHPHSEGPGGPRHKDEDRKPKAEDEQKDAPLMCSPVPPKDEPKK